MARIVQIGLKKYSCASADSSSFWHSGKLLILQNAKPQFILKPTNQLSCHNEL